MVSEINSSSYNVSSLWQYLFNKIDQNADGSIDKTEMGSTVSNSSLSVEDVFVTLDSNQDGVIGKNEFEEVLSKLRSRQAPAPAPQDEARPSPEEMFNKMDANGDGSISKDEMESAPAPNGVDVDKVFDEMDTNKDGLVSQSEMEAHMKEMGVEKTEGTTSDSAANQASEGQSWESKLLEALLSAYKDTSKEGTDSLSHYV